MISEEKKFKNDNPDFPICFETDKVRVYTNSKNEIFVENMTAENECTVRITQAGTGFRIMGQKVSLIPHSIDGMKWVVTNPEECP